MKRVTDLWLAVLAAFAGFALPALGAEPPAPDPQALIQLLRNGDFDARRTAVERLTELGEAARAALEEAAAAGDVDTRETAAAILARLERATLLVRAFDRRGKPAAEAEADVRIRTVQRGFGGYMDYGDEGRTERLAIAADGTAALPGALPRQVLLDATWKKWTCSLGGIQSAPDGRMHAALQLNRGPNTLLVTVIRHGTISLRALDAQGNPLKDAIVRLSTQRGFDPDLLEAQLANLESWSWDRNLPAATTDATGAATVECAEGVFTVIVRADGCLPAVAGVARVREGQTATLPPVRLARREKGQLTITLLKEDGSPLKKTRVNPRLDFLYDAPGPRGDVLRREARRLAAQMAGRRPNDNMETDDDGKLVFDDLRAGRYTVCVSSYNQAPWDGGTIAVPANGKTVLPPLKPAPAGSIKGKVTAGAGKGIQYASVYAVPEAELDAEDSSAFSDWRFRSSYPRNAATAHTQNDGGYEIKAVPAGRHCLYITTQSNQICIIFGLVVEAGKTAAAPEAQFPSLGVASAQNIKGVILMPDGQPAAGANISLSSPAHNNWGRNCDEQGRFDFSGQFGIGADARWLAVRVSGCRPCLLDLASPGIDPANITLRLERQEYGALRITVTDEENQPLSGVMAAPAASRRRIYHWGQQAGQRAVETNRAGVARLPGLAVGARSFEFAKEGYFLPGELKTTVAVDTELALSVKLRKGATVAGTLVLPPGHSPASAQVVLHDWAQRVAPVGADGRFAFPGVLPGECILAARAPGLVSSESITVSVGDDGKPPAEITLRAVPPGGLAVALTPAHAGHLVSLTSPQTIDGAQNALPRRYGAMTAGAATQSVVDADGRAEFPAICPGAYEALITPAPVQFGAHLYGRYDAGKASASLRAGTVEVKPFSPGAAPGALPEVALRLPPAAASVRGRVVCDPTPSRSTGGSAMALTIKLTGSAALASMLLNYPHAFTAPSRPAIIGAPPARLSQTMARLAPQPGYFVFEGLPAGEYQLHGEFQAYDQMPGRGGTRPKPVSIPLATVTIKDDDKADLGILTCKLPPDTVRAAEEMAQWQLDTEPEDRIPVFQP
jgi:protocatechuate 3,4-dioxygenase beta subunit